jgi:hypothetical protein
LLRSPILAADRIEDVPEQQGIYVWWLGASQKTCLKVGRAILGTSADGLRRRLKQHLASDLRSSVLARHLAADRTSEWSRRLDLGDRSVRRKFLTTECSFQSLALPDLTEDDLCAFERFLERVLSIRYIGRLGSHASAGSESTTRPLLTEPDVERVSYALHSLREFHDGYMLRKALELTIQLSGPIDKFLMNAEQHYLYAYYMTETANGLLPLLRRVGLERHAIEVEQILARRVGKATLREVMSGWRNKWLVHTAFAWDRVDNAVMHVYDPEDPEHLRQFRLAIHRLYRRTFAIYLALRRLAPLETSAQDEHWPFERNLGAVRRS